MAWSCVRGGAVGVRDRGCTRVGMERAAQGCGHNTELLEFKGSLDTASRHKIQILGDVWSQELDSVILMGTFQLRIFHGSTSTADQVNGECWLAM